MLNSLRTTAMSRAAAPLEAQLLSFGPLRAADLDVVRGCSDDVRTIAAGSDIAGDAKLHERPRLIVSGWAAAARYLPDGRRQVLQIFVPGDVLGLSVLRFESAKALTRVTTSDARPLARAVAAGRPENTALSAAWEQAQSARYRELLDQIVRLGRLSAYERTGHLLLELVDRHRRAGLSDGRSIPWPLTQETLADVLGLSVVHVNRILQQLRREGLVALRAGQLALNDLQRLATAAAWES